MVQILYHFIRSDAQPSQVKHMLSQFKKQGWEFVSVFSEFGKRLDGYIFKKAISK